MALLPEKFSCNLALLFLSICFGSNIFAGDGFVILKDSEQPPEGVFVFAVQNLTTGQMYFGYSQEKATDPTRRVNTVLPGHTHLIAHALGVTPDEYLRSHVPIAGMGNWVGGGFIKVGNKLILNRYHSLKAAGTLEKAIDPRQRDTVNPQAPKVNPAHPALLHPDYWPDFFSGVLKRFGMPLQVEFANYSNSKLFPYNSAKNGEITEDGDFRARRMLLSGAAGLAIDIEEINKQLSPTAKPKSDGCPEDFRKL